MGPSCPPPLDPPLLKIRAVEDSCHSLKETKIQSASCAIAAIVNCCHHLHGRMNRTILCVVLEGIPLAGCICCHVSRWRNSKNSAKSSNCCVLGCSSATQWDSSEVIPTPTPLCKHHYHLVYSALQSRECATCGVQLRGNNHWPCPKPDAIQKHLKESTGFEGEIATQSG